MKTFLIGRHSPISAFTNSVRVDHAGRKPPEIEVERRAGVEQPRRPRA